MKMIEQVHYSNYISVIPWKLYSFIEPFVSNFVL